MQGRDVLYSASEVVRLGEKKLLQSDGDWDFLSQHLLVLNQNWTRYLAEQRRESGVINGRDDDPVQAAFAVLDEIGLEETSDANAVIERVAAGYFGLVEPRLADCVQLAQIATKLGATVGDSFRYVCADGKLRSIEKGILFDEDRSLEDLLPEAVQQTQLLHSDYLVDFKSCSREDWVRWVSSGRSGLQTFAPLIQKKISIYGRQRIEAEANARGFVGELYYPYITNHFIVDDWNFSDSYWEHWEALSREDPGVWAKIMERILKQREYFWSRTSNARLLQVATTGRTRPLTLVPILAAWLLRLRDKPCLTDTRDVVHLPADLMRRTPETESLIDVELFVKGFLDREATRPLLDMLGVQSVPAGPERLLDRLRALAGVGNAPTHEVEKWYRRLDQMLDAASTLDAQSIKDAFKAEKLILAQDGTWVTSGGIFLAGDEEDVPGAAIIRPSVLDLSLWRRIGVAERPSADLALKWLGTLESGKALSPDDARRVRTLMSRYPSRIWDECAHWVNLASEWVETDTLSYGLSMQSLFSYGHLHESVKCKTADFRPLSADTVRNPPFSSLPTLSDLVEERFNQSPLFPGLEDRRAWLTTFGTQLARIELTDTADTERVRTIAAAIAATSWVAAPKLEVVPYLDGVPAGTARLADIVWLEDKLFVSPLSKAKLAKRVPEEIGKSLSPDIRAALTYAFERSPEDIKAYLEENFTLGPEQNESAPLEGPPSAALASGDAVDEQSVGTDDNTPRVDEAAPASDPILSVEEASESPPETEQLHQESDAELLEPQTVSRPRTQPKLPRPSVIARFALALGYKPDGEDRFYHSDGSWIGRSNGALFPWERRSASGDLQRHYYPKEHCLEHEPLQIEADVWGLLDQKPDAYSFILVNPEGDPVEMTGARLRALREGGEITIHPATYRLVYDLDK